MSYLQSGKKSQCFGCGGCEQVCPVKAITMTTDSEGFSYPSIDNSICVNCGRCTAVCPAAEAVDFHTPGKALAGHSVQKDVRSRSASGGAFWAIAKAAPDNAVIFGAEWNGRSTVCHGYAPAAQAYERFHKSKYIQSQMGRSYIHVKQYLRQGTPVIFTGTPCQIAGLRAFLGEDDPNLLCVDLVCHGVPSGKVLEKYLQDAQSPRNPIKAIEFRYKNHSHGKWDSKCAKLIFASGKEKIVDYDSSAFLRGFATGLFFRPSCGECPFAQRNRVSDLTIGDCWGIEKHDPAEDPHKGISLVLVNTPKGEAMLKKMTDLMEMKEVSLEMAVAGNARLGKPDKGHKNRADFFAQIDSQPFGSLVQKYVPRISAVRKIGHRIKLELRKWKG